MVKFFHRIKNNIRTLVQIVFTALTNGYVAGFQKASIYQGNLKSVCLPGLNCYSCPGALGSCPLGALQSVFASPTYKFSFYAIGFLFAFGAMLGRFVCGWLCPFGLVQDLLYKIPLGRKKKNLPGHQYLKHLRYLILVVFVILLPLFAVNTIGQGSPWFCKIICPSGTLMGGWTLAVLDPSLHSVLGGLFAWKSFVLISIIVVSVLYYRPFCKYLCPLGGIYGLFNPIAFYRFDVSKEVCTKCGSCREACPMDIQVSEHPNSFDCIRCGKCIKICPQHVISSSLSKGHCNCKRKEVN